MLPDPDAPSLWLIVIALLAIAGLALVAFRHAVARNRADSERDNAVVAETEAVRLVRLVGHDLHELGLAILGQAGAMQQQGVANSYQLSTAAGQLLGLADELGAYGLRDSNHHILREQSLDLYVALAQSVAAVATQLANGRRSWRLPPASAPCIVQADPRALRHILTRVLSNAIRHTGQDDWIEISLVPQPDGLAVVVQDEGTGMATPNRATSADSRGIGLRLALARNLMLAHGGRLDVEATAGVGCRVSLQFPHRRLEPPKPQRDNRTPIPVSA